MKQNINDLNGYCISWCSIMVNNILLNNKVYYAENAKVTSSGTIAIGHAFDKATADGDLIRVMLDV